jgi:hypothetical protein
MAICNDWATREISRSAVGSFLWVINQNYPNSARAGLRINIESCYMVVLIIRHLKGITFIVRCFAKAEMFT